MPSGGARALTVVGLLFFVLCAPAHSAQSDYPARPIRLIVPYPPGGGADALARVLTPKLSDSMKQTWVVDNRGGSGGVIGTELATKAQPDGYTALLGVNVAALTVSPTLYPNLTFSVIRDLQPVTKIASAQYIFTVHPSLPAATVSEFIALAKRTPGKINYGSSGVGSPQHLAAELLKFRAGIDLVHVAYKGGGPAALALLAGEVQVVFNSFASTLPQVKAGKLRALAVTGPKRSVVAPDFPTVAESGFPGFDVTSWYALLVPAKTPPAVVRRLYDETVRAVRLPDVREAFSRQGQEVDTSASPEELDALIRAETASWAKLIKAAGIKGE